MKIPDDVTIKINSKIKSYTEKEILDRVRDNDEYGFQLWCSDNLFRMLAGDCEVAEGSFIRTVKTRRVAWDLPEGFRIPDGTKMMLEKSILSIADWQGNIDCAPVGWIICAYAGGHGAAKNVMCQFSMRFLVTESTEELPWSPFEQVQK